MTLHVGQFGQEGRGHADVPQGCVVARIVGAPVEVVELNIRPPRALCRPQKGERRTPVVVQHDPIHDCATRTGIAVLPADDGEQRFTACLLDGLGVKEDGVPGHRFQHCSALDTTQHDISQSLESVEDGFVSHANVRPPGALPGRMRHHATPVDLQQSCCSRRPSECCPSIGDVARAPDAVRGGRTDAKAQLADLLPGGTCPGVA